MYKEYNVNLNKFIERKNMLDEKIEGFNQSIIEKEDKLKEMKLNYTDDFLEGKVSNTNKIKALQSEIEGDREQLEAIKEAYKNDKQLKELGIETMKEYKQLEKKEIEMLGQDSKEKEKLKEQYEKDLKAIDEKAGERKKEITKVCLAPRVEVAEYINYNKWETSSLKNRVKFEGVR